MTNLTLDVVRKMHEALKAETDVDQPPIAVYPWEAKRLGIKPTDKGYYIIGMLPTK